jgi:glyoxylase-like metal-dependent hydrolase (beta-lactamase superfamily II)
MTNATLKSSARPPIEVAPGVFRLGSPIVNWYLLDEGGRLTAIDAGLSGYGDALEAHLAALGFGLGDVEAVILTHSDGDHTGLAARMRDAGARVLIGTDDAATLAKPGPKKGDAAPTKLARAMWRPSFWRFFGHMARNGGAKDHGLTDAATYRAGDVLDVPGRPRALATPGHTAGHCSFLFEERRVLFAGDALCTWNPLTGSREPQLMPRVFNEDNAAARASLDTLAAAEADLVLPGHGDPWEKTPAAAVERARTFL